MSQLTASVCYTPCEVCATVGNNSVTDSSFCGDGSESVQHVFLSCPKYEVEKRDIETLIKERLTPENIVLESKGNEVAKTEEAVHKPELQSQLRV